MSKPKAILRPLFTALSLASVLLLSGCWLLDDGDEDLQKQSTLSADVKKAFGADPNKYDSDGDGLSDDFEITKGYPFLKPNLRDSDSDGIEDSKEDNDSDGLDNLKEQELGTSPVSADTDSDGLSDSDEKDRFKTNPLKSDTDGDGISDGREVANGSDPLVSDAEKVVTSNKSVLVVDAVSGSSTPIGLDIKGPGDIAGSAIISALPPSTHSFKIGVGVDIKISPGKTFESAQITLPYDPTTPGARDANDFIIITINPANGFLEALPTVVDPVNKTLTATTTHFSPFWAGVGSLFDDWLSQLPKVCVPVTDPNAQPTDVVLVIDSSGSMSWNDPSNLRIAAAKSFITAMKPIDRTAVVDFDDSSRVAIDLSSNQNDISGAIDSIDSSGGTNIGAGIRSAIDILQSGSDSSKLQAIFLLTDGDGAYSDALTAEALRAGIRIFTIGLGSGVNQTLLSSIANGTGGAYKQLAAADGLVGLFEEFSQVFGDTGKDTDGDGLTDCQETYGVYVAPLERFVTSKIDNVDSDDDGIDDNLEVGVVTLVDIPLLKARAPFGSGLSDPMLKDTDGDTLEDGEEYDEDTKPYSADADRDGFSDVVELEQGSDPNDPNDPNEQKTIDASFWQQATKTSYLIADVAWKAGRGLVAGELATIDEWPEYIGLTARNFIPSCGVLDGIDAIALAAVKDDKVSAGLSLAGSVSGVAECAAVGSSIFSWGATSATILPALGADTLTAIGRQADITISFLKAIGYSQKNTRLIYQALEKFNVPGIRPHDILAPALKALDPGAYAALEKAGLSAEDIVKSLAGIRKGEVAQKLGKLGEDAVNDAFGFMKKGAFEINGRQRIADGLDAGALVVREVKNVKYQGLTRQIQDYIDYSALKGYRVELFVRETTGLSQPLLDAINAGKVNLKFIP